MSLQEECLPGDHRFLLLDELWMCVVVVVWGQASTGQLKVILAVVGNAEQFSPLLSSAQPVALQCKL